MNRKLTLVLSSIALIAVLIFSAVNQATYSLNEVEAAVNDAANTVKSCTTTQGMNAFANQLLNVTYYFNKGIVNNITKFSIGSFFENSTTLRIANLHLVYHWASHYTWSNPHPVDNPRPIDLNASTTNLSKTVAQVDVLIAYAHLFHTNTTLLLELSGFGVLRGNTTTYINGTISSFEPVMIKMGAQNFSSEVDCK